MTGLYKNSLSSNTAIALALVKSMLYTRLEWLIYKHSNFSHVIIFFFVQSTFLMSQITWDIKFKKVKHYIQKFFYLFSCTTTSYFDIRIRHAVSCMIFLFDEIIGSNAMSLYPVSCLLPGWPLPHLLQWGHIINVMWSWSLRLYTRSLRLKSWMTVFS